MPTWTPQQLRDYENHRAAGHPQPERAVPHEHLGAIPGEATHAPGIVVRITSYRARLLDFDNLAGGCKYLLDGCRYAGLIPDDNPAQITLQVSQSKVTEKTDERTEVEIISLLPGL